ncbi:MAG: MFS transporter [Alphaproteobacteria bacterium]|jgi:predicted MFS family arabinose efflux permease
MLNNRWAILALLIVVRLVMGYQFQAVASMTPFMVADLGLDYAQIGTLVGFYMLPGIIISLPGALFGRRYTDLTMVLFGVAVMALGGVVSGLADSFAMLAFGRLIGGVGAVLQSLFMLKMVAEWFDQKSVTTAMAILLSGWPVGVALALTTMAPMAAQWGWQVVMYISALSCLMALISVWLGYRPPPGGQAPSRSGIGFHMPRRELGLICYIGVVWAFYNLSYFSFLSFGPAMLIERGMDAATAGAAISLSSWAALPALPLGGYLADRTGRPGLVLTICCIIAAMAAAALPLVDQPFILSAMIGLFAAAPAGIIMGRAILTMSPANRTLGNAILYTFFYGGMGLAPGLVGWSADISGTAATPIFLSAAILALTAPLFLGQYLLAKD